jgi:hypothetical protein
MEPSAIMSREQSLQILMNDLRNAALERRAVELKDATPQGRETIFAEIDSDIQREVRRRATEPGHQNVIY